MTREQRPRKTAEERFWEKVNKTDNCWLWTGSTFKIGPTYISGSFLFNGRRDRPSRVSWILHRGPIPEGMHVLHTCDVGYCVNPNHLYLGTPADNAQDRQRRGRWGGGMPAHKAKLYKEKALELYYAGNSGPAVARMLNGAVVGRTVQEWVKADREKKEKS